MKKVMILVMTVLMLLSMAACGSADKEDKETSNNVSGNDVQTENNTENNEDVDGDVDVDAEDNSKDDENTDEGANADLTIAQNLLASFKEYMSTNSDVTAQAVADEMLSNEVILFAGASMPVEAGLLMGFGEAEITGFEEGVMFAPMIGSIPFVGYIFVLGEDADAEAFVKALEENADPRWNICVEADETVVECVNNVVFFLMSPYQIEG